MTQSQVDLYLDVILPGTGRTFLHLHPVVSEVAGGQGWQVVRHPAGWRGLLTRGVTVRRDGRESRVLLQRRRGGEHHLEICYC